MKKKTLSLANTPVRRALNRAQRSTLLILVAAGFMLGLVYKTYFAEKPAPVPAPKPAVSAPQNP